MLCCQIANHTTFVVLPTPSGWPECLFPMEPEPVFKSTEELLLLLNHHGRVWAALSELAHGNITVTRPDGEVFLSRSSQVPREMD